jgi:orotidine-5'-phosphate decarboxylase
MTEVLSTPVRDRLAVALDLDSPRAAVHLARDLSPWFGVAKVGYQLYGAAGPAVVSELIDTGLKVFLDLKLHDIPTTVGKGARVLGRLGVTYLNFHAAGGMSMLQEGCEGLAEGAAEAGHAPPFPLAVTVLTSDEPDAQLVAARAAVAAEAGCRGVVCAATDIATVRNAFPDAVTMVPGIRSEGTAVDDQVRVSTPRAALEAGASVIVVGRTITKAPDVTAAAEALVASLAGVG